MQSVNQGITREWVQFSKGGTGTDLYCLDNKGMSRIFNTVCSLYYKPRQLTFTSYETAVGLALLKLKVSLERTIIALCCVPGHFLVCKLRAVTAIILWYVGHPSRDWEVSQLSCGIEERPLLFGGKPAPSGDSEQYTELVIFSVPLEEQRWLRP